MKQNNWKILFYTNFNVNTNVFTVDVYDGKPSSGHPFFSRGSSYFVYYAKRLSDFNWPKHVLSRKFEVSWNTLKRLGMSNDIKEHVRKCPECQLQNQIHKESSILHPFPVKSKVFTMVGLDLDGPLKTTTNGNRFVAVLTDYFSKRPEVKALQTNLPRMSQLL